MATERVDVDTGGSSVEELRASMKRRFRLMTAGVVALMVVLTVAPVAANHLTVRSSDIVDGAVRTRDLHADAVGTHKINDGGVHTPDIRNKAVGPRKLKPSSVTRHKLGTPIRTKSSEWQTATAADDLFFDGTNMSHRIIEAPAITQQVIDRDGVEVYLRFFNRSWSLPYVSHAGGRPNTLDFFLTPGQIHITRFGHDNTAVPISGFLQYRYVITPEQFAIPSASPMAATDADDAPSADSSTE